MATGKPAALFPLSEDDRKSIADSFTSHPDFPKPGIVFVNILPLFQQPALVRKLVAAMAAAAKALPTPPTVILGVEARGFIFAPLLAEALSLPFVPVRKAGKLPGECVTATYYLEYGTASIQVAKGSVKEGDVCVVCDDLLATGGTANAACGLLSSLGATVASVFVVVDLGFLGVAAKLPAPVQALVSL